MVVVTIVHSVANKLIEIETQRAPRKRGSLCVLEWLTLRRTVLQPIELALNLHQSVVLADALTSSRANFNILSANGYC